MSALDKALNHSKNIGVNECEIVFVKKKIITVRITDSEIAEIKQNFDVIVLPDVIEHIPLEQHDGLFGKLSKLLNEDGFMLIHIPEPEYLEWVHVNKPEELQVIDNPIHTDQLLSIVYKHGFKNICPITHYFDTFLKNIIV